MEKQKHSLPVSRELDKIINRNIAHGKELDIRCDVVFKSLFSRNTPASREALRFLLGAATGQKVESAEVVNGETTSDMLTKKVIRMDIKCRFSGGQLADIEMQKKDTGDIDEPRKRMNYYNARLMSGQIESGKPAGKVADCHQISFLDYEEFRDDHYYHHIRQYDQYGILYEGGFQLHFFELTKLKSFLKKPVEELSDAEICGIFIKYEGIPDYRGKLDEIYEKKEGLRMAKTVLKEMSRDWKEWAQQETRLRYEIDYMLAQEHQKHVMEKAIAEGKEKGFREGLQEGKEQGLQRGLQKGLQEGHKEGLHEHAQESARRALNLGLSIKDIAKITGLTEKEIKTLKTI